MRPQHVLVLAVLILLGFVITEHRLADDSSRRSRLHPGVSSLWSPVVEHRRPLEGCVFVTSLEPDAPYDFTPPPEGVLFDIDADGFLDSVSWPAAGSSVAFLALDQDDDGAVTHAGELVGEHTLPGARNAAHALLALAARGSDGGEPAMLDADDPLFLRLLLWTDGNRDGASQPAELRQAREVLAGIGLGFSANHHEDRVGNQTRFQGSVFVRTAAGPNPVARDEEEARRRPLDEVCLSKQAGQEPPAGLPAGAAGRLADSLAAARRHPRHAWRDTPPFDADGRVEAYVEIPRGDRRKWEFDMARNVRAIDRVIPDDPGAYPVNYGFVPQTISYDGDPFDVLVLGPPVAGGQIVAGIVVGLMHMEDEKGLDSKVVVSPVDADGRPRFGLTLDDQRRIGDYFRRYKLHEPGKFSRVPGWAGPDAGLAFVRTTHAFFIECRAAHGSACRAAPR